MQPRTKACVTPAHSHIDIHLTPETPPPSGLGKPRVPFPCWPLGLPPPGVPVKKRVCVTSDRPTCRVFLKPFHPKIDPWDVPYPKEVPPHASVQVAVAARGLLDEDPSGFKSSLCPGMLKNAKCLVAARWPILSEDLAPEADSGCPVILAAPCLGSDPHFTGWNRKNEPNVGSLQAKRRRVASSKHNRAIAGAFGEDQVLNSPTNKMRRPLTIHIMPSGLPCLWWQTASIFGRSTSMDGQQEHLAAKMCRTSGTNDSYT